MFLAAIVPFALATAPTWTPLRVALDCQSQQRVQACTYLRGTLDGVDVVAVVPRSDAQVVLYVNATAAAGSDFLQLRAVADPTAPIGAPPAFEQTVEVDSRLPVDDQRALLEPALTRVLAPFVSLAVPEAVSVTFTTPAGEEAPTRTTPWGFSVWAGGYGRWTRDYQYLTTWTGASLSRLTNDWRLSTWVNYDRSIELQPSLVVDSQTVALSSDSSAILGDATLAHNLDGHWTVGGNVRGGHQDAEGQYLGTVRSDVGVEYNVFPADDPRGNVLAVAWLAGGQADWYNQTNTLGQTRAVFPASMLLAKASVRVDTVTLSLDLAAKGQLAPFVERYVLGAEVGVDLTLGDHVDLSFDVDATQQAIPGPASVDESSYEAVTRASYAEPLQLNGNVNLRFHWDNTNSARNNRFQSVCDVDVTDGL